ncbi:hypothetical protein B0H14DRAFT_3137656 [Mycena olivaceomarginata]|nr:hypothetical protein B0H14DRAFT_3137656 [Mycena olivaceomarginata]
MCNHSTTTIPTVQRTAETAPTETEVKPVNHSNGPQCAHCGWRGGGHAVIPRPTLSESPHAFSILPAINQRDYHILCRIRSHEMRGGLSDFPPALLCCFSDYSRSVMLGTESPRFVENRCDPRQQNPRLPMMAVLDGFKLHQLNGKAIIRRPRVSARCSGFPYTPNPRTSRRESDEGFAAPRRLGPERRLADASAMASATHVIITAHDSVVEIARMEELPVGRPSVQHAQDAPLALSNARMEITCFSTREPSGCAHKRGPRWFSGRHGDLPYLDSLGTASESGGCEGDEGDFSGVKYISLG